ncbi:MAG: DNA recombination protein RmuC [Oscillospiraceae bacterium]
MEYIICGLCALIIILLVIVLVKAGKQKNGADIAKNVSDDVRNEMSLLSANITGSLGSMIQPLSAALSEGQKQSAESQHRQLEAAERHLKEQQDSFQTSVNAQLQQFRAAFTDQMTQLQSATEARLKQMSESIRANGESSEAKLEAMRKSMSESMAEMRAQNEKKLDEIRGTVDEKLQDTLNKRIAESFRSVSEQLERVQKGLGEMQTLANDVGGLKKVLSGVKTRGILGEVQLQAILSEILTPSQYDVNVATIPGSTERVEFAVRLPGADDNVVYLPIDSKFPGDTYAALKDAQETGDKAQIEEAYKQLERVFKAEAKDIFEKYVEPPYTTTFGIMFLPFEGLYSEAVNRGLLEELQNKYHVNIAGPSTMAALLNSLQMGFKTLAIQKQSNEVWRVLGEVKSEFEKFEEVLVKMQRHLEQTSGDLNTLIGTRTRAIQRKLRGVQEIELDPGPDSTGDLLE